MTRASTIAQCWQDALFSLRSAPHVIDVRTIGLVGGIEIAPREGAPGSRGYEAFVDCFARGLLVRVTGDIIALSPPLIVDEKEIGMIVETIGDALRRLD